MTKTTLTDGSPVTPDHREINPASGMQKGYVVLSAEERNQGFVEPVRQSYVHQKCGAVTTMGLALAETYARQPEFYSGTFCVACRDHFPVGPDGEFVWDKTSQKVGTRQAEQPFEGTDDRTIADCVSRFPGNGMLEPRELDETPTLYRTAGKQVLEGNNHFADARDEVAAAVITKALNRS